MPTHRFIEIELPTLSAIARAQLLDEQAPSTCQLIWDALPIDQIVYHCIRCGSELFALVPPLADVPPAENRAMVPTPGDLWFVHFPADYRYNPPDYHGDPRGVFDLIIWYGPDSWALDPGGNMIAGNHWARICDGLDGFARASEEVWLRGTERIVIRRAE